MAGMFVPLTGPGPTVATACRMQIARMAKFVYRICSASFATPVWGMDASYHFDGCTIRGANHGFDLITSSRTVGNLPNSLP